MSEGRLLQPHEITAQRAWAEEEGRPEIIAVFQHVAILERQLAEAQGKLKRIETELCMCATDRPFSCLIHDTNSLLARTLKEENDG